MISSLMAIGGPRTLILAGRLLLVIRSHLCGVGVTGRIIHVDIVLPDKDRLKLSDENALFFL
jgi:hypothetical protein